MKCVRKIFMNRKRQVHTSQWHARKLTSPELFWLIFRHTISKLLIKFWDRLYCRENCMCCENIRDFILIGQNLNSLIMLNCFQDLISSNLSIWPSFGIYLMFITHDHNSWVNKLKNVKLTNSRLEKY